MQATEEITAPVEQVDASPEATAAADADQDWTGESGAERTTAEKHAAVNDWMRGTLSPTSKPDQTDAAGESTPADENGQTGDVKPAAQARPQNKRGGMPRRGAPEAVQTAEQRIADLEAQLAERDPEKLRAQWESERDDRQQKADEQAKLDTLAQTQQANVERYHRLNALPTHQLTAEDYSWLEDFKEKLSAFPEVQQFHQADMDRRIKAADEAHTHTLRQALSRHVAYPGVEADTFRTLADWGDLGDHLYESGQRSRQSEVDKLKAENGRLHAENRQLKVSGRGGLGAADQPAPAGRSSSAAPIDTHAAANAWLRGG